MTLQILDNLWDLKVNQAFSNTQSSHSLGVFTSPYVVILVSSNFALPLWRQGGNIAQSIILPDNSLAYSPKKELVLNQYSLLEFSILSGNNYELFYFPLTRLETVQIKVWEYVGQTKDQAIENLVATLETSAILTVDFSELNPRLSSISTLINSTSSQVLASLLTISALINNTGSQVLARLSTISALINSTGSQVLVRLSTISTLINSTGFQVLTRLYSLYVLVNSIGSQVLTRLSALSTLINSTSSEVLARLLTISALINSTGSQVLVRLSTISALINSTGSQVLVRLYSLYVLVNSIGSQVLTRLSALSTLINSLGSQVLTDLDSIYALINSLFNKPQILIRVNGLVSNQPKEIRLWEQTSIAAAIKIESIYIDSPADDKIKIEVLTSTNIKLTEREFDKQETPYDFPDLVISKALKVKFTLIAGNPIDKVFIYCSSVPEPVVIDL